MNIAIVLSGGTGNRIGGDVPKQYIEVEGQPIIAYCLRTLEDSPSIDAIQIVADEKWIPEIEKWVSRLQLGEKIRGYSRPGENRQMSIFNGLTDVGKYADDEDYVFIHDPARPFLSEDMIRRNIEGMVTLRIIFLSNVGLTRYQE